MKKQEEKTCKKGKKKSLLKKVLKWTGISLGVAGAGYVGYRIYKNGAKKTWNDVKNVFPKKNSDTLLIEKDIVYIEPQPETRPRSSYFKGRENNWSRTDRFGNQNKQQVKQ